MLLHGNRSRDGGTQAEVNVAVQVRFGSEVPAERGEHSGVTEVARDATRNSAEPPSVAIAEPLRLLPSDASVNMPLSIESSAKERSNQPSSERHDATEYRAACQVFSDSVPHTEANVADNVEGDECAAEAKADEGAADSEGVVDADAKQGQWRN